MDKKALRAEIREKKRAMTEEEIASRSAALGELFLASDAYKNAKTIVKYNGEEIISKKRPRLAPGEMENVIIKNDMLKNFAEGGVIEISVEV